MFNTGNNKLVQALLARYGGMKQPVSGDAMGARPQPPAMDMFRGAAMQRPEGMFGRMGSVFGGIFGGRKPMQQGPVMGGGMGAGQAGAMTPEISQEKMGLAQRKAKTDWTTGF